MFEDAADVRFFQSCVAREVRRGTIEVHSFCIMTTHYHLLIRSLNGDLSAAMKRIAGRYSRYFNRRHRRDGALVRGRFFSKRVRSLRYRRTLVRYIDANPVQARLASCPWDYRFGSAKAYVHGRIPPWLTTTWIKAEVTCSPDCEGGEEVRSFSGANYIKRFGSRHNPHTAEFVERRLAHIDDGSDDLDSLITAAPPRVLAWMQRKARLADGGRVGEPMIVQAAGGGGLGGWAPSLGEAVRGGGGKAVSSKCVARIGLLRSMAAMTWGEIARALNLPESTCRRHYERHAQLVLHEPLYAAAVSECGQKAIGVTFGVTVRSNGEVASDGGAG